MAKQILCLFLIGLLTLVSADPMKPLVHNKHHSVEKYTQNYCPHHLTKGSIYYNGNGDVENVVDEIIPCPAGTPRHHVFGEQRNTEPLQVVPQYKGSVVAGEPLSWSGECFQQNVATAVVNSNGATLTITAENSKTLLCSDMYLLATSERIMFENFLIHGKHTVQISSWKSQDEYEDVLEHGVRVFLFNTDMIQGIMDAYELYRTFMDINNSTASELVQFTKEYFNYTFIPREPITLDIDPDMVQGGDTFALHAMTPHETFDWALSGSHTGHITLALRVNGTLYVAETTDATFFPGPDGFHMTPFNEWVDLYAGQGYEITWMRLRSDLAAKFDDEAAYEWWVAHHMQFLTPSFGFTVFDTPDNNVPYPLSMNSLLTLSILVESMGDAYHTEVQSLLTDSINMRLNKYYGVDAQCTSITCAWDYAAQLNTSLPDIVALPEIDGWQYAQGPSIVCVGMVTNMLRAGGVFGDLDFNCGEFCPKDFTELNIFDDVWADRPAECFSASPISTPYCQLAGSWAMELPWYNTIEPHDHMFDGCGALPPTYQSFPVGC